MWSLLPSVSARRSSTSGRCRNCVLNLSLRTARVIVYRGDALVGHRDHRIDPSVPIRKSYLRELLLVYSVFGRDRFAALL
jgi:hypothetical protein